MKKNWARLMGMTKEHSPAVREILFRKLFLLHHANADEIIARAKDGKVLAAVYYTLDWHEEKEKKEFCDAFRKACGWDDVGYDPSTPRGPEKGK